MTIQFQRNIDIPISLSFFLLLATKETSGTQPKVETSENHNVDVLNKLNKKSRLQN